LCNPPQRFRVEHDRSREASPRIALTWIDDVLMAAQEA
jgi:hypothetical protein